MKMNLNDILADENRANVAAIATIKL